MVDWSSLDSLFVLASHCRRFELNIQINNTMTPGTPTAITASTNSSIGPMPNMFAPRMTASQGRPASGILPERPQPPLAYGFISVTLLDVRPPPEARPPTCRAHAYDRPDQDLPAQHSGRGAGRWIVRACAGGPCRRTGAAAASAALVTEMRPLSHGEVILDRLLAGYGWEGEHHRPQVDVVALYLDQFPDSDLSRERADFPI